MAAIKDWLELIKYLISNIAMWHVCALLGGVSLLAGLGVKIWDAQMGVSPGMELLAIVSGAVLVVSAFAIRWRRNKHQCEHEE